MPSQVNIGTKITLPRIYITTCDIYQCHEREGYWTVGGIRYNAHSVVEVTGNMTFNGVVPSGL